MKNAPAGTTGEALPVGSDDPTMENVHREPSQVDDSSTQQAKGAGEHAVTTDPSIAFFEKVIAVERLMDDVATRADEIPVLDLYRPLCRKIQFNDFPKPTTARGAAMALRRALVCEDLETQERNLIAAALDFLTVEIDPVHALIATHKATYARFNDLADDAPDRDALNNADWKAWDALCACIPSTTAGLAAMAAYIGEHAERTDLPPYLGPSAAMASIAKAAGTLAGRCG